MGQVKKQYMSETMDDMGSVPFEPTKIDWAINAVDVALKTIENEPIEVRKGYMFELRGFKVRLSKMVEKKVGTK